MEIVIKKFEELSVDELYEILKARVDVFVVEQQCPYLELDEKDKSAYHIYLKEDNKIKAYARVLDAGVSFEEPSVGRVLTTERGKGYGGLILKESIKSAQDKFKAKKIRIAAQLYAKKFYEKYGFRQASEEFSEDGILHIEMILE